MNLTWLFPAYTTEAKEKEVLLCLLSAKQKKCCTLGEQSGANAEPIPCCLSA